MPSDSGFLYLAALFIYLALAGRSFENRVAQHKPATDAIIRYLDSLPSLLRIIFNQNRWYGFILPDRIEFPTYFERLEFEKTRRARFIILFMSFAAFGTSILVMLRSKNVQELIVTVIAFCAHSLSIWLAWNFGKGLQFS